ncbi:MAG: Bug family tripartite tricarboxylate transporter substrate binding protein [Chloroflexota bacterium]
MRFSSMIRLRAVLLAVMLGVACAPAPSASPTAPPAKPSEPAKPAASPAASPAAKPAASPAASPSAAAPSVGVAPAVPKPTFNETAVADFYRGKTIKIIVGYAPGGGYDVFARLIARHAPKYIPGTPTIIVENRPGAGSMLAANTVYAAEPKDGTVIGTFAEFLILQKATGVQEIQFDPLKYNWLGASTRTTVVGLVRNDSKIEKIQDIMNGREINTASPGRGSASHGGAVIMNLALGTNFKNITGYSGAPEAEAAFQKGEADAYFATAELAVGRIRRMIEGPDAFARIIVHAGGGTPDLKDPLFNGVPSALDLAKTEESKQLVQALNAPTVMLRPFAFPPDVPVDRVAALRYAISASFADPEFIAEARPISPAFGPEGTTSGAEIERIIGELFKIPPVTLVKLRDQL